MRVEVLEDSTEVFYLYEVPCSKGIMEYSQSTIPDPDDPFLVNSDEPEEFEIDEFDRYIIKIKGYNIYIKQEDLYGIADKERPSYIARIQNVLKQISNTNEFLWNLFLKAWDIRLNKWPISKIYNYLKFQNKEKSTEIDDINQRIDNIVKNSEGCRFLDEKNPLYLIDYHSLSYYHLFIHFIGGKKMRIINENWKFIQPTLLCLYGCHLWWAIHIACPEYGRLYTNVISSNCRIYKILPIEMHPESFVWDFVRYSSNSFTLFWSRFKTFTKEEKTYFFTLYSFDAEEYYHYLSKWDSNEKCKKFNISSNQIEIARLVFNHELSYDFKCKK
jgi:hypothetical protein